MNLNDVKASFQVPAYDDHQLKLRNDYEARLTEKDQEILDLKIKLSEAKDELQEMRRGYSALSRLAHGGRP